MLKTNRLIKVFIGIVETPFMASIIMASLILVGTLLTVPQISFADWDVGIRADFGPRYSHRDRDYWEHHYYRWHEHPSCGWREHFLPYGYRVVWVRGARYFYYDGLYYSSLINGDYILVQPPLGAYVPQIPVDFQTVIIHGRTYYTDNGIYYILTRRGYRVVAQPIVYTPVVTPVVGIQTYPVNIPNHHGSYTTVIIRRSGMGYVGPQGEYYAQFPSVEQLRAMYER